MIPDVSGIQIGTSYRHCDGGRYRVTGKPVVDVEGEDCPGVSYTLTDDSDPTVLYCSAVQFCCDFTWEPV